MSLLIGAIADDFTGATDLAGMLRNGGMRTVQLIGAPRGDTAPEGVDAIVIALKSRTTPSGVAIADSLGALAWLRRAGARQIFFKYCSTFDSTAAGNIGPVAEALMEQLQTDFTVFCPAFPENGRTVYMGHLFLGDRLVSETGMRTHPLTPMTDPDLVRVLASQSRGPVGLASHAAVREGASALRAEFSRLRTQGVRLAVVDAISDGDLRTLAQAVDDLPLITGGSGLALGIPDVLHAKGLLTPASLSENEVGFSAPKGFSAIVSGSCSTATLGQIEAFQASGGASRELDPLELAKNPKLVDEIVGWAADRLGDEPIMIHASAPAARVALAQASLGKEAVAGMVEGALGRIAAELVGKGVTRLVVAGGETSGAVTQALGVEALEIGPMIDPGVPWTLSVGGKRLALALKSGNFGGTDFFRKAFRQLP